MRPAACLAFAALAAACNCQGTPIHPGPDCPGPSAAPGNPSLSVVGHKLTFEFGFSTTCDPPVSMQATVFDPENTEIESQQSLDAYLGTVSFTPRVPGAYHLTARFEPNRGIAQADVLVVADRSGEPALDVTLPGCVIPQLTDAGLIVCRGQTTQVFRAAPGAGTPIQSLARYTLVDAHAEVLWVSPPIARLVAGTQLDGGPGYAEAPDAGPGPAATRLWANHDDALAEVDGNLYRYRPRDDGGLEATLVGPGLSNPVAVRVGDELLVYDPMKRWCVHAFDGGTDRCTEGELSANPVGADDVGVWFAAGTQAFFRLDAQLRLTQFEVPAPWVLAQGIDSSPRLVGPLGSVLPRPNQARLELEFWGPVAVSTSTTIGTSTGTAGGFRLRLR
ncbi:MAG: hypothetical protein IPJ65_00645 [Archangiaceae bacterium]|nr:hypothetical protein [Archangiaceae bacterium]